MKDVIPRIYPEYHAGGFTRDSHWLLFFSRVNALIRPDDVVVDYGAGRGEWLDPDRGYRAHLGALRGRCARLIGVDVDKAVRENRHVDEAVLIAADGTIALPDNSVDLIYSWAVLEHVEHPEVVAREIDRILKPGGWFCAWTPNKHSYVGIGVRLLPNHLHVKLLQRMGMVGKSGQRQAQDVFPTFYRMNSAGVLRRLFPSAKYRNFSYRHAGPPNYHGNIGAVARMWQLWGWVFPEAMQAAWHIFMRKR